MSAPHRLKQALPCGRQPVQAGLDPVTPTGSARHGLVMGVALLGHDQLVHGEAFRARDLDEHAGPVERHGRNGVLQEIVEMA